MVFYHTFVVVFHKLRKWRELTLLTKDNGNNNSGVNETNMRFWEVPRLCKKFVLVFQKYETNKNVYILIQGAYLTPCLISI